MDSTFWDRKYEGSEYLWTVVPNRSLVAEVDGLSPGRVLDLACGEGRNAVWLAQQGWQVTAVDFSAAGLDKARRLADEQGVEVEWIQADLVEWTPPPASFDLVVDLYVHLLPSVRNRLWAAAAAARAPGGVLVVVGHDRTNLAEGHGGPQRADILFSPDDVVAAASGLDVVRAERVRRPVETDAGTAHAIDALVRLRAAG